MPVALLGTVGVLRTKTGGMAKKHLDVDIFSLPTHSSCINSFCDPLNAKAVTVPDLMICAPWAGDMLGCLYDGADHSDCCASNQVPEVCSGICAGNVTEINYKHFRCIEYMPVLAYCTLKRFDVLPSEPLDFRFSNIGTNIGLLHWERPDKHAESVTGYQVTWEKVIKKSWIL